jgi:ABC-type Fe3+-siderophore transport system permease subunit
MKSINIATIGIRLVGVAWITCGVVLALSGALMHGLFQLPLDGVSTSDLYLHDTCYVVSHVHFNLIPSGASIVVGVLLLLLSRRFARLLGRGLDDT